MLKTNDYTRNILSAGTDYKYHYRILSLTMFSAVYIDKGFK